MFQMIHAVLSMDQSLGSWLNWHVSLGFSLHMLEIKWDVTVSVALVTEQCFLNMPNVSICHVKVYSICYGFTQLWKGGAPRRLCNMFTFIHLADAYIQSDLEMRNTTKNQPNIKNMYVWTCLEHWGDFVFPFFHEGNSRSSSSWEIILNCLQVMFKKCTHSLLFAWPICQKHKTFHVSSHSARNYTNHIN